MHGSCSVNAHRLVLICSKLLQTVCVDSGVGTLNGREKSFCGGRDEREVQAILLMFPSSLGRRLSRS